LSYIYFCEDKEKDEWVKIVTILFVHSWRYNAQSIGMVSSRLWKSLSTLHFLFHCSLVLQSQE
jgi:hypothetical protein